MIREEVSRGPAGNGGTGKEGSREYLHTRSTWAHALARLLAHPLARSRGCICRDVCTNTPVCVPATYLGRGASFFFLLAATNMPDLSSLAPGMRTRRSEIRKSREGSASTRREFEILRRPPVHRGGCDVSSLVGRDFLPSRRATSDSIQETKTHGLETTHTK